jgi:hypothetical protein
MLNRKNQVSYLQLTSIIYNKILMIKTLQIIILYILFSQLCIGQTTQLVTIDSTGSLIYTPDEKGNIIPDFSGVGYKNSEHNIPNVPVVKTLTPITGDNYSQIQAAIDEVAALPINDDSIRGAILFKAGTYDISEAVLIKNSGIVLRGEGSQTILNASGTVQYDLINIIGTRGKGNSSSSQRRILDTYVPIGAKTITVEANHSFKTGDWVHIIREPNDNWIDMLGMNRLTDYDPLVTNWSAGSYRISFERQILNVQGNLLTLDASIVDPIDQDYATGFVVKFNSYRITQCGVENMKLTSAYKSSWASSVGGVNHDEEHAWNAIIIDKAVNCWVRNVDAYYFGYACVNIQSGAAFVTVENCGMYDPISKIEGGRRYSFNINGQRNLVKNCSTRLGRHDYATGSRVAGPNVFYNSVATQQRNDIGPHHRWATGILFDNITGDGKLRVQDRNISGSGHGWAGAQIMFWNCTVNEIVIQDPQSYHCNWAIGCIAPAKFTNVGEWITHPLGIVESAGTRITAIPSLFEAQLNDRLKMLTSASSLQDGNNTHSKLTIYPNPAVNHVTLKFGYTSASDLHLSIIDMQGKQIKKMVYNNRIGDINQTQNIDISELQDGLYIIHLLGREFTETIKFNVKK